MSDMNGHSFEMGKLWGELVQHMRSQSAHQDRLHEAIDRQTEVLIDLNASVLELPTKLSGMTDMRGSAMTSEDQNSTEILDSIQKLLKAVLPVVIILSIALDGLRWEDLPMVSKHLEMRARD